MSASPNDGPIFSAEPAGAAGVLRAQVCVVGGGPAGAACALKLARLGHEVLLVERAPPGRPHIGESLPPGVLPLLDELGLRAAVEGAGFLRPRGALVQWEGPPQRHAPHDEAPGFQVDRGRFDALLLDAARAAGVGVLQPQAALEPVVHGQGVSVPLKGGGRVAAQQVVLAHGRHAGQALGPPTAALYAYWEGSALTDDPRTRVEAAGDAWYWGAPLPDGSFNAAVFIEAARCTGLTAARREALYRRLLQQSGLLSPCLGGTPRGAVQVCDATPRVEAQSVAPRVLKAGEAAFSIDPLSSQGVQAALRSGLQAAACVHTRLLRPQDEALVAAFHRAQVERTAARHARWAAQFAARAAQRFATAFWRERAAGASAEAPAEAGPLPPLEAWVALDAQAVRRRMPALSGDFVIEAEALLHPALEAPVCFIGGRPISALLDALGQPRPVRELLHRWRPLYGERGAIQLLMTLWRQGVVGSASSAA